MGIKIKLTGSKFGEDIGKITEPKYIDDDGDAVLNAEDQRKYGSSYAFDNEFVYPDLDPDPGVSMYTIKLPLHNNDDLLSVLNALKEAGIVLDTVEVQQIKEEEED